MYLLAYAFIIALSSPLLLIPVERLLPFPYIIEEIVKLLIVLFVFQAEKVTKKSYVIAVVLLGTVFTFSESMMYLTNFYTLGNFNLFPIRLAYTGILHIFTISLMYLLGKNKWYLLTLGLTLAIILHYLYNLFI